MANKKKFYKSKTFWFNLAIVLILGLLGIQVPLSSELELTILGLVNIGLRFLTTRSII